MNDSFRSVESIDLEATARDAPDVERVHSRHSRALKWIQHHVFLNFVARQSNAFKFLFAAVFFALCVIFYTTDEGWSVVDTCFFLVFTLTTVGYGSVSPSNDGSRAFTIFLMVFGIVIVFASLSNLIDAGIRKLNAFLLSAVSKKLKRVDKQLQRRLLLSLLWVVSLCLMGALVLSSMEGWSFFQAFYFVVQTVTNRRVIEDRREQLKLQRSLTFLADSNGGLGVSKFEFVLTILQHIGVLNRENDVGPWLKKFALMDAESTGWLTQEQLRMFSQINQMECEMEIQHLGGTEKEKGEAKGDKELGSKKKGVAKMVSSSGFSSSSKLPPDNQPAKARQSSIRQSSISSPIRQSSISPRGKLSGLKRAAASIGIFTTDLFNYDDDSSSGDEESPSGSTREENSDITSLVGTRGDFSVESFRLAMETVKSTQEGKASSSGFSSGSGSSYFPNRSTELMDSAPPLWTVGEGDEEVEEESPPRSAKTP
mmetsp:Transcript_3472/g.7639  ORF Transcript_3472/g.7639 Transcript_3472/m.7639 type:complete len:483 (+) Transcript_3472:134-1582(+)